MTGVLIRRGKSDTEKGGHAKSEMHRERMLWDDGSREWSDGPAN